MMEPETRMAWIEEWERQGADKREDFFPQQTVACLTEGCVEYGVLKQVPNLGQEVECGLCRRTIREEYKGDEHNGAGAVADEVGAGGHPQRGLLERLVRFLGVPVRERRPGQRLVG